jgi:hypothetical protein
VSSIVEKGAAEVERRRREEEEIREVRTLQNFDLTTRKFRFDFCRDHYVRDPSGRSSRMVEDPENPVPPVENWHLIEDGYFADAGHFDSTFTCEGLRYVCRWRFHGTGGDRAYWDDGWWPDWFLIVRRRERLRWLPLVKVWREVEVPVYGPENVAEALKETTT